GFGTDGPGSTLALSPDGALLAQADGTGVRVWDLEVNKELGRLAGHQGAVTALAFSPDGRRLATGSSDTTVLVWDVATMARRRGPPVTDLFAAELQEKWATLARDDAGTAFDAIRALATAKQTIPFLKQRLKPAVAPDAKQVANWIGELDQKKFDRRRIA